jgi:hypothetical protein
VHPHDYFNTLENTLTSHVEYPQQEGNKEEESKRKEKG